MTYNFTRIEQIRDALNTCRSNSGLMAQFPIPMKIGIIKFREAHWKGSTAKFSKKVGVHPQNFAQWTRQYKEGLYKEGASYSVSRSALKSSSQIIKELEKRVVISQKQLELAKECEKNGLVVTLAA